MLNEVAHSSTSRLREVRTFLNFVRKLEPSTETAGEPETFKISKGLFFVHLYGAFEYTVNRTVVATLESINSVGVIPIHCKPRFNSMVLDSEFKSLLDSGHNAKWRKRLELLGNNASLEPRVINTSAFSYDLMNVHFEELEILWNVFCIDEPVFLDMKLRGRITELVDNRNKISHGRESPNDIGRRYSVNDLEARLEDINEYCSYIVSVFGSHLSNQNYILKSE